MKNIYRIGLTLALFVAASCSDDFLVQKPIGAYSDDALLSPAGINGVLIGAYSMVNGQGGMVTSPGQLLFGSIRGGEAHKGSAAGDQSHMLEVEGFSVGLNNASIATFFQFYYNAIDRTNLFLTLLPKATGLTDAQRIQMEAEGRFLRAHFYFHLKRLYNNVPFIDFVSVNSLDYAVPNTDDAGNYVDIWPKIKEDMDFARKNLLVAQPEWGRPNRWAAEAYYGKILLYMGNAGYAGAYTEALTAMTSVITSGRNNANAAFALNAQYYDNYNADKENAANPEWVWGAQHSVNDGTPGNGGPNGMPEFPFIGTQTGGANSPGFGRGFAFFNPSQWFVDHFRVTPAGLPILDNAARIAQTVKNDDGIPGTTSFTPDAGFLDPRLDWTVGRRGIPYYDFGNMPGPAWIRDPVSGGNKMAKKYFVKLADKTRLAIDGRANAINVPVIRFADVILMAAELEARVGSVENARVLVNQVRNRMTNQTYWVKKYVNPNASIPNSNFSTDNAANYLIGLYPSAVAPFDNSTNALRAILMERTLELGLEGHRAYDIIRFGMADGGTTDTEEFNAYIGFEKSLRTYLGDDTYTRVPDSLVPIPQQAADNSFKDGVKTLKQNPGY